MPINGFISRSFACIWQRPYISQPDSWLLVYVRAQQSRQRYTGCTHLLYMDTYNSVNNRENSSKYYRSKQCPVILNCNPLSARYSNKHVFHRLVDQDAQQSNARWWCSGIHKDKVRVSHPSDPASRSFVEIITTNGYQAAREIQPRKVLHAMLA